MGFIASYPTLPNWIQRGLMIGFLGGFTTFSAYALDSIKLLESFSTNTFESILYIFGSPVFCIGAAFCGRIMYRFLQGGALGA